MSFNLETLLQSWWATVKATFSPSAPTGPALPRTLHTMAAIQAAPDAPQYVSLIAAKYGQTLATAMVPGSALATVLPAIQQAAQARGWTVEVASELDDPDSVDQNVYTADTAVIWVQQTPNATY